MLRDEKHREPAFKIGDRVITVHHSSTMLAQHPVVGTVVNIRRFGAKDIYWVNIDNKDHGFQETDPRNLALYLTPDEIFKGLLK